MVWPALVWPGGQRESVAKRRRRPVSQFDPLRRHSRVFAHVYTILYIYLYIYMIYDMIYAMNKNAAVNKNNYFSKNYFI